MKKAVSLILCLVLAVSLGASCFADAIAEYPNKFYEEHYREFERAPQYYYVAASGSVAQKTPLNSLRAFKLEDGFVYDVYNTYTDGEGVVWACITQGNDYYGKYGWLPIDSLRPVYGFENFYEDHRDEFVFADSNEDCLTVDLSNGAVIYSYPGSSEKSAVNSGVFEEPVICTETWVDENGITWANGVTKAVDVREYLSGTGIFWFCLDNPLAGFDLAPNADKAEVVFDPDAPEVKGIAAYGDHVYLDDSTPSPFVPENGKTVFVALGITLVAAILAVVLAVVLKKKR